jgi:pyridoxal phosphate enzyme (YggS family)
VTKTYPVEDVQILVQLGVHDIGESRDQEARGKVAELAERDADAAAAVRWHVVGRLQTNKARSVVSYAHAVHSVDRPKLARALADAAADRPTPLSAFVQVSLDDDPDRGGVPVAKLTELVDLVANRPELRLAGLMSVPPIDADPDAAFARLQELSERVQRDHPQAGAISAGMTHDLEAALRHGSTHVRVGTALLGRRAAPFG